MENKKAERYANRNSGRERERERMAEGVRLIIRINWKYTNFCIENKVWKTNRHQKQKPTKKTKKPKK